MAVGRAAARALVFACTVTLSFLVLLLLASAVDLTPGQMPHPGIPVFLLLVVGVPCTLALWVDRRLRRRWPPSDDAPRPSRRAIQRVLVIGYVLTAVFGVPSAISRQNAWAVAEYKQMRAGGSPTVWDAHPYIWAYGAVPVLPGVILSYHEYQVGGVYGLGTFELAVWYGVGSKSLGELPIWIS
jgi:hypothetical protein